MESGQFVRVKESFLQTDSFTNEPSLVNILLHISLNEDANVLPGTCRGTANVSLKRFPASL